MTRFTVGSEARELHDRSLVVDLHVDTLLIHHLFGYDMTRRHRHPLPRSPFFYQADLPRMREGGVDVVGFGLVLNPLTRSPERRMAKVKSQIDHFHAVAAARPDELYLASAPELIEARRGKGVGGVLGIEGAHALAGRIEWVKAYYDLGVRYLTLAHFSWNAACNPAQGWGSRRTSGLTDFGRDVVRECNRLGMVLDLAHVNKAGFLEAARLSKAPFIVSHTGLKAIADSARYLDDEQLRAVADRGGVVGIIWAPYWTGKDGSTDAEGIVDSMVHVIKNFGADHVGIGSDIDGFLTALNVGLTDISSMPVLTELLLRRGVAPDDVAKVLGGNFLRVYKAVHAARENR
jgi:membrane dipeptidase